VGAVIAMAAHLEGKSASVLDFMGFAQKGGAVLSFVRMADTPARLNQVRIDTQQADAILACDLVVGASPEALQTVRHGRTRVLANTHEVPVAESLHNPDASLKTELLLEKLRFVAGDAQVETFDAQSLAEDFLGDSIVSNILAMGYAWQRGLIPVSLEALLRAIELNGVAVESNKLAFSLGRLAAADPKACDELLGLAHTPVPVEETLDMIVNRGIEHLSAYQNAAYAQRFVKLVREAEQRERQLNPQGDATLAKAVARSMMKLMAYKDEYEVARLYSDGGFREALSAQFEGDVRLEFYMAPPLLARGRDGQAPRKIRLGEWMLPAMKLMARGKVLRGTALDVFGWSEERRMERKLIAEYESRMRELLPLLDKERLPLAAQIAAIPLSMRGFGHVKLANVEQARTRESELLHRLDPKRFPRSRREPSAGQLRGIPITVSRPR
jgi:indolepyruvate ferredoxin oxidoreductase